MSPTEEAAFLDAHGDVRGDAWPQWVRWQAARRGWVDERGNTMTGRIAQDRGFDRRTVQRWLNGTLTPDLGVRRAIAQAWMAPVEAEVMGHLRAAVMAAASGFLHVGGGGVTPKLSSVASAGEPPTSPPPIQPSPAALAAALARRKKP